MAGLFYLATVQQSLAKTRSAEGVACTARRDRCWRLMQPAATGTHDQTPTATADVAGGAGYPDASLKARSHLPNSAASERLRMRPVWSAEA